MQDLWHPPHISFRGDLEGSDQAVLLKALRAPLEKLADNGRACGGCQACCEVLAIDPTPDVASFEKKAAGTRCKNQEVGRCSIYERRPLNCAVYFCWWRIGWGEKDNRPDKLGLILDAAVGTKGRWVDFPVVIVRETEPGVLDKATGGDRSRRDGQVGEVVAHWENRGFAVLFHYWGKPDATGGVAIPAVREAMQQRGILGGSA